MQNSFFCCQCPQIFATKKELKTHREEIHKRKCEICSKSFINYSRHVQLHEGRAKVQCHICGREVSRMDNLRRHMKSKHPGRSQEKGLTSEVSNNHQKGAELDSEAGEVFTAEMCEMYMSLVYPTMTLPTLATASGAGSSTMTSSVTSESNPKSRSDSGSPTSSNRQVNFDLPTQSSSPTSSESSASSNFNIDTILKKTSDNY